MNRRTSLSLLAVLLVAFAATGVGATTPSGPAVEPAPEAELTAAPICTQGSQAEAVTPAEEEAAPSAAGLVAVVVESGWYYGICVPNYCQQCTSDYDCTPGNSCQFGVHCP